MASTFNVRVKVPFVRLQLSAVALWRITRGKEFKGSMPTASESQSLLTAPQGSRK